MTKLMPYDQVDLDGCNLVVERGVCEPGVTLVERKGWGHPDTLADHLAERLSRAYSRYSLQEFGVVLHHNFDKLGLLGGSSEVRYGSGRMVDPVRVLVNGRAARSCGGVEIPLDELLTEEVRAFFAERVPELESHLVIEFNVSLNSSPGAVLTDNALPERYWRTRKLRGPPGRVSGRSLRLKPSYARCVAGC